MSLVWTILYTLSVLGENTHWEAANTSFNLRFW